MADVFLSYARANINAAKRIATALRAAGFSVWFDEELPAHRAYSEVIEEQLESAGAVIVVWSSDSARSQWVRSEGNRARESGRLVQVRVDDTRLPMPFDQIHCADLRKWRGSPDAAAWKTVLAGVAATTGTHERLTNGSCPPAAGSATGISRRRIIIASGATVAISVLGFAAWRGLDSDKPPPEAQLLLQKGLDALQTNDALETESVGSTRQAIVLLSDAVRADPSSAMAWGGLAMAYAVRKKASPPSERPGLDARSRAAAKRALGLEPEEPRALGALLMLAPLYRNWLTAERERRAAVQRQPRFPILLFLLSEMLGSVGRWREAADLSDRLERTRFLIPGADRKVIINRWAAGDLTGADEAVHVAVQQWPQHPQIWRTRLEYLMYSGRASEALDLLGDMNERPSGTAAEFIDSVEATAQALEGTGDQRKAVKASLAFLETNPSAALQVAQACAAVGAAGTALRLLEGYYFAAGEWAKLAPPGGDQDRMTIPLFQPPMRLLWGGVGFQQLLERTGLTGYWRESKTVPDYRRRS